MKVKQILAIILALSLLLSLSACGGGSSSEGGGNDSQPDVVDSGSFNCDLDDIETDTDTSILSCSFEFENMDDYEKNPDDFLEVIAIQDKEELQLTSGSISSTVDGLTKAEKQHLEFEFKSDNPIMLKIVDKETGDSFVEYSVSVDD